MRFPTTEISVYAVNIGTHSLLSIIISNILSAGFCLSPWLLIDATLVQQLSETLVYLMLSSRNDDFISLIGSAGENVT